MIIIDIFTVSVLRRLKRLVGWEDRSTETYSMGIYRCNECDAIIETDTSAENPRCPECQSEDIRLVTSSRR